MRVRSRVLAACKVTRAAFHDSWPRVIPREQVSRQMTCCFSKRIGLGVRADSADHANVVARRHFDAQHEFHGLEPLGQCADAVTHSYQPRRFTVIVDCCGVLDAAVGIQHQQFL